MSNAIKMSYEDNFLWATAGSFLKTDINFLNFFQKTLATVTKICYPCDNEEKQGLLFTMLAKSK